MTQKRNDKALKPIKFGKYVVKLGSHGFMGYVHYRCIDVVNGETIASGGISRLNYQTDKAHRAAIKEACEEAIAKLDPEISVAKKPYTMEEPTKDTAEDAEACRQSRALAQFEVKAKAQLASFLGDSIEILHIIGAGLESTDTAQRIEDLIKVLDAPRVVVLTPDAALKIEDALATGFENCGDAPECVYAEPLVLIQAALGTKR